jgi:adenine-specific DNA-methyltransferase
MPESWKALVTVSAATEGKTGPKRCWASTLDHFTARNIFDYFIHKDLALPEARAGFLYQERVVPLDDLAALPADHLAKVQGKSKAIRAVAIPIIDFLAAIENFQKRCG